MSLLHVILFALLLGIIATIGDYVRRRWMR